MRAMRARTARAKFIIFTVAVTLGGTIYVSVTALLLGMKHFPGWWFYPLVVAAFGIVGAVFGWMFFLADGDGQRK